MASSGRTFDRDIPEGDRSSADTTSLTKGSTMTTTNLSARDLADVTVLDTEGETYRLGDAWSDEPAILVFVRHYG